MIGAGGYYVRKFSRSLQYTIAETRDGIRIGFGLVSTSNETLPPGRIHAVSVAQPLLWRPFGWWDVRINRATNAGNGASNNQQVSSIVLPVGTAADVREVLDIILPGSSAPRSPVRPRHGSSSARDRPRPSTSSTTASPPRATAAGSCTRRGGAPGSGPWRSDATATGSCRGRCCSGSVPCGVPW
ncbi:PH domain-containing protein [Curtobacterium flaccumfaciens]|nr:PH domain-containing protein [Curtobacterium flaccumfaciens]